MEISTLLIISSYFWGAIPTAYLAGRYINGVDIRTHGSGNVGAANLTETTNRLVGTTVGVFDCIGKGTLPIFVATMLDMPTTTQVAVGLATVSGHNWSPYMRFKGGRGVATSIGVYLGFMMWPELLFGVILLGICGALIMRETALLTLPLIVILPFIGMLFNRPSELVTMAIALGLILIVKRLLANWETSRHRYPLSKVLLYRLLWDRDVRYKDEWTSRQL